MFSLQLDTMVCILTHILVFFLRISETDYRALRTAVAFTNTSLLSLEQVGPQVTLSVFAQNSRNTTTGTAFPRSTLYIHVPTDLVRSEREGQEVGPLLIPFDVVVNDLGSGVNCSQYEAVPKNLVSGWGNGCGYFSAW